MNPLAQSRFPAVDPRLALGPCQYFWPRGNVEGFYRDIADSPVDIVYLGETVCAKRRELRPDEWIALGREMAAAGKEVVLSTLTLIEALSGDTELGLAVKNVLDTIDLEAMPSPVRHLLGRIADAVEARSR